jgi:Carboxypeptidase regulatory-like domain
VRPELRVPILILLIAASTLSGCLCWFLPCDRRIHVSGTVVDAAGAPIEGAKVELFDDAVQTKRNGCFRFRGTLAVPGFRVTVSKPGYKTYREERRYDLYDLRVTLVPEDSPSQSTAVWRELRDEELAEH